MKQLDEMERMAREAADMLSCNHPWCRKLATETLARFVQNAMPVIRAADAWRPNGGRWLDVRELELAPALDTLRRGMGES